MDSSRDYFLLSFAAIAFISIVIRTLWKYLYKLIPRLPFKPKWPNFVIGSFQIVPFLIMIYIVCSWYLSPVTEKSTDYDTIGKFVTDLEIKYNSIQTRLSGIQYPSHSLAMRNFFPREIFEVRFRLGVLERYDNGIMDEFEKWVKNNTCGGENGKLFAFVNDEVVKIKKNPLDKTIIGNAMNEWKNVERKMKDDPVDVTRMHDEKNKFDKHMKRTKSMFEKILKIWKSANDAFREGIYKVTKDKNKEVIFVYGLSAIFTIIFGFWSFFNTLLFSQYHLPRLWLKIMKTLFYICACQAIFLASDKYQKDNEFRCDKYSRSFDLFNFDIPSFHTASGTNTKVIFSNCVQSGKTIFSNRIVDAKKTNFVKYLEQKTTSEVAKVFAYAKKYNSTVEARKNEVIRIVEALTKVRETCPEVENVLNTFNSSANLLEEYFSHDMDEKANSYPQVYMPLSLMDQFFDKPVLEFNKIIEESDFNCQDMYNTYLNGYNMSCTAVNSVVVEHLEMMVIACSSLLAFFHLFYFRRADYTQFWDDVRVRWAEKTFHKKWDEEQYEEWKKVDVLNHANATYEHFNKNRNRKKNRYDDIGLIDQTRVVLRDHTTDYIHASWIPVPGTDRSYIATQGPMPNTFPDFWHMIWQENVKIIVMTCGFIEMDRRQCGYYFPSTPGQTMTHGNFEVRCTGSFDPTWGTHTTWHTTTRTFKLLNNAIPNCEPRIVKHEYMWHWFDMVVPRSIDRAVYTHVYVDTLRTDDSPVVVHCDTGIGRAATFIALDVLKTTVEQGKYESMVDVAHYIASRRVGALGRHLDFIFCMASCCHWFIQELILYDEDYSLPMKLYQDYCENKIGLQNYYRCKKEVSIHYWRKFEDPHWFHTCEIKLRNKREVMNPKDGGMNMKNHKKGKKKRK